MRSCGRPISSASSPKQGRCTIASRSTSRRRRLGATAFRPSGGSGVPGRASPSSRRSARVSRFRSRSTMRRNAGRASREADIAGLMRYLSSARASRILGEQHVAVVVKSPMIGTFTRSRAGRRYAERLPPPPRGHGDAHELRAGPREFRDLLRGRLDVGGVGVRHRLHDDRAPPPTITPPTSTPTRKRLGKGAAASEGEALNVHMKSCFSLANRWRGRGRSQRDPAPRKMSMMDGDAAEKPALAL